MADEKDKANKTIEDLMAQIQKLTAKTNKLKISKNDLKKLKVDHQEAQNKIATLEKEKQSLITTALNAQEDQRKLRIITDKFTSKPLEFVKLIHDNVSFNNMIKGCAKQGVVKKQGGAKEGKWQNRHLVLNDSYLYYYASTSEKEPRGVVRMDNDSVISSRCDLSKLKVQHAFTIVGKGKTVGRAYYFYCETEGEANDWVKALLLAQGWPVEEVTAYLQAANDEQPNSPRGSQPVSPRKKN